MEASGFQRTFSVLFVVCFVLSGISGQASAATIAADVTALNDLLREWGPSAPDLNWVGDPCLDLWSGVVCDPTNTTVITLSLDCRNLSGQLPPGVGGLANLEILELSVNKGLTGPLPKELANLQNLKTLSLQFCSFTGSLPPEIGNLVSLKYLGVNGNNLTGRIPDVLGNLKNLTWLDISMNNFSGPLPISTTTASGLGLDSLTAIQHFHFFNNSLSGSIPPEIFSLPNLIHSIMDHNQLNGTIPAEIANSKSMKIMRLDFNQLDGPIPSGFNNVTTLTELNFKGNKFTGILPDLSALTQLQGLDFSENNFERQQFPSWALGYPLLQTLSLSRSSIVGELPPNIFKLPMIETLDLQNNNINGSLTFTSPVSSTLTTIILDNNEIDGFVGRPKLQSGADATINISLYLNPLCKNSYIEPTGPSSCLPFSPYSLPTTVPAKCAMECNNQKTFNPKLCICAYPLQIELQLTAPSSNLDNQTRRESLETELATKITDGSDVTLVSGQVWIRDAIHTPDIRIILDILFFSVLNDSLSGKERIDIVHMLRQNKLSLSEGPFNVPNNYFSDYEGEVVLTTVAIALIAVGAIVGLLLLIGVITYVVRQRRILMRAKDPFAYWGEGEKDKSHGAAPKLKTARPFSLSELKETTNNWNELLGEGGYGKVYKGTLKNGDIVAIKRANKNSKQGLLEFKNELELLSRVHHRNLVDLVGFCYESGEQAVVYEFMSNGTLRERLYERVETPLTWKMRLDIILNSARGLAYLHDHASPPIIHGDVKSANILLNHKMIAKVADFGLSKPTADEGEKVLFTDEIRGTRGYLDPEYFQTHVHTDKSDVYSFGVVMVEVLTGKSPTHGGKGRTREFRTALEMGGLAAVRPLMDPLVQGIPDQELQAYIGVALACTAESGEGRPTMTDVVKELEAITGVGSFARSGNHNIDMGNKSPEVYSDTVSLVNTSASFETEKGREGEGNSFQYSGTYAWLQVLRRLRPRG